MSTAAQRRNVRLGLIGLGFERSISTRDKGNGMYAESWENGGGDLVVVSWAERTPTEGEITLTRQQQLIADLDGYVKHPHPENLSLVDVVDAIIALREEAQPVDWLNYPATPEAARVCPHLVRYWRGHECGDCEDDT